METTNREDWILNSKDFSFMPLDGDKQSRAQLLQRIGFRGNTRNGLVLLDKLTAGIKLPIKDLRENHPLLKYPQFGIYNGDKQILHIGHVVDPNSIGDLIFARKDFLEDLSKLQFHRSSFLNIGNSLTFVGTVEDWAFILGVEESHHSAYQQIKRKPPELGTEEMSLEEYKALPGEYEAFEYQLEVAKKQRFPRDTVSFYEGVLKQAREIRKRKGLPINITI